MGGSKVVCCRADERCGFCIHATPHEPKREPPWPSEYYCTIWSVCMCGGSNDVKDNIKRVRCVKVREG